MRHHIFWWFEFTYHAVDAVDMECETSLPRLNLGVHPFQSALNSGQVLVDARNKDGVADTSDEDSAET